MSRFDKQGLFQSLYDSSLDDLVDRKDLADLETLPVDFFLKPTVKVASALIGKCLIHKVGRRLLAGIIVETEAYLGNADEASHSARGETPRSSIMFGKPGTCYVYLSYGINFCMNVVTAEFGIGEAVLIRAVRPILAADIMQQFRGDDKNFTGTRAYNLTNGPGKLTVALGINLTSNGKTFFDDNLKLVDLELKIPKSKMTQGPRIGLTKATDLPYRFYIQNCPWVTRKGQGPKGVF